MPQHHDQGDLQLVDAELEAAEHGGVDHVAGRPDGEEVAETLVQDGFDRDPAVDAAEAGCPRALSGDQFLPVGQRGQRLAGFTPPEAGVAVEQRGK
jgi:hypothetical protein